ncbi:putative C-S lyase [Fusobacterium necrophorum]|uniref:cysteine-S-conjugate beta-lyase n=1 Tax=Fusobacterium necrophorum TaxID=859 RepID=A0A4Q2KXN1_9FUSO|nr:PatB family C-S lyase [Fusobacterium necrophorum]RXZ69340.1 putative C-S lyase [Fusobacterium necrophorum]
MMKDVFMKHWDRSQNISAKWDELEAKFGEKDLYPLWIADMDFPAPEEVVDAVVEKAKQGIYGYTARPSSYYQAICDWTEKRFHYHLNPKFFIHSPGGVTSFTLALDVLTEKGDAIIVTPPVYPGFFRSISGMGRKLVTSPMLEISTGNFEIDWEDFEQKIIQEKVKLFIFCNPHNPIGKVYKREELQKIADICLKHKVQIIEDQMWRDLTFGEAKTLSLLQLGEEVRQNTIACFSATKTFNLAGLHASFLYVSKEETRLALIDKIEVLDIHRNNALSIVAMETAFRKGENWLDSALEYLEENLKIAVEFIQKELPQVSAYMPESTYTLWVNFSQFSLRGEEITKHLAKYGKIATGNGSPYGEGGETCQRINLACSREVLFKALEGLKIAVKAMGE